MARKRVEWQLFYIYFRRENPVKLNLNLRIEMCPKLGIPPLNKKNINLLKYYAVILLSIIKAETFFMNAYRIITICYLFISYINPNLIYVILLNHV